MSMPMTPMTLRGMYFYMADAATFTDCATGKRFMVANNAELERGYWLRAATAKNRCYCQ